MDLSEALERLKRFLSREMWQVPLTGQPKWRQVQLRQLQLWVLVGREFIADRCLLHAAALTAAMRSW